MSALPPSRRRLRLLSFYLIFVALAVRKVLLSGQYYGMEFSNTGDGNSTSATEESTRVLIVRTMAPVEVDIVIKDVLHVKSFYAGEHEAWVERSRSRCGELRAAGYAATPDPYENGTRYYPNHLLCKSDVGVGENYFLSVRADFMLLARNEDMAQNVSRIISEGSARISKTSSLYEVDVDIRDVSLNPHKIWNWISLCTSERLAGYDYIWFIGEYLRLRVSASSSTLTRIIENTQTGTSRSLLSTGRASGSKSCC